MTIAPDPILQAGLFTLHVATVDCRNWTLRDNVPLKMINDLMEAIHEVPEILSDWDRPGSSMETMLLHLSSFDAEAWKQKLSHLHDANVIDLPKLVAIFQDKMDSLDDG